MRATLNIDDELIQKASKLTGIVEKTALVRLGLVIDCVGKWQDAC